MNRLIATFWAEIIESLLAVGSKCGGGALRLLDDGRQGGALLRLVPKPQFIIYLHLQESAANRRPCVLKTSQLLTLGSSSQDLRDALLCARADSMDWMQDHEEQGKV